jgi:Trypsin-like peptidase domain
MQKAIFALIATHMVGMLLSPQQSAAKTTQEIVAAAKPSVVIIVTFDANKKPMGQGTGFFITERHVATNHHIIENAPYIGIYDLDGTRLEFTKVISDNPSTDLAILETTRAHPFLFFKTGSAVDGENVTVIGNPKGLEGTISTGIVSAANRSPLEFQITAPISPGSSGSPVLDEDGYVLGMIRETLITGQNLNFAIRANWIMDADSNPRIDEIAFQGPELDADMDEAVNLVGRYMNAMQNGKPISLAPFVTSKLREWYGDKNITIAQAEASMAAFYKIWPIQWTDFDMSKAECKRYETNGLLLYEVRLPFGWAASNGKKTKSVNGVVNMLITRAYRNGKPAHMRIVAVRNLHFDEKGTAEN